MGEKMREDVKIWADFLPGDGTQKRRKVARKRNFHDRERKGDAFSRVAVVTTQMIREPNKNPMSKICSRQTLPRASQKSRPVLRDAGSLFHVFSLSLSFK